MSLPAQRVKATFYADKFSGRRTTSGEVFNQERLTAASPTLPIGSVVRFTNLQTNQVVYATINDRMPGHDKNRVDMTKALYRALGLNSKRGWGWIEMSVESRNSTTA